MGIRFQCPNGHKLNVKADLAGKRASCPECGAKLVIPNAGTDSAARPVQGLFVGPPPSNAAWFLRTAGGDERGPATEEQFCNWIAAGEVTADAYIWREGWAEWKPARDAADALPMPLVAMPVAAAPAVATPPIAAAPVVATLRSAEPIVEIPTPDLDLAMVAPLISEPIVADPSVLAASTYAFQRQRGKKMQLTLAIAMLVAVIVLAAVLVWVLRNNVSSTSPTSHADNPPSAANC